MCGTHFDHLDWPSQHLYQTLINEKYETVYLWLINYSNSMKGTDQQKSYTVIIPNFAVNSNFKNKGGWYLVIF